jgi:ankyrin repeat protein
MLILSKYTLRGFAALEGLGYDQDRTRALLRRFDLIDELLPAERALLLERGEPTRGQITDATWRAEALVALRWATGDFARLELGGQVSLMQAVPDLEPGAVPRLRAEADLRRALELWFVVYRRMRLRLYGVDRFDLAGWIERAPSLTTLTPDDVPLLDGDLSLDASVMAIAADDADEEVDWPDDADRVAIGDCTEPMLSAGENVLRVATERLRALRWLFGVTDRLDEDPVGVYRPDSNAAGDKAVLFGAEDGEWPLHRAAWRGDLPRLRALLREDADTLEPDVDGDLAIHCAVLGGQPEAVRVLLAEDPVSRVAEDAEGRVALHLAAARGDLDALDAATGRKLDGIINIVDHLGRGPLHEAIRHGHAGVVDRLVAMGADLDGAVDIAIAHGRADLLPRLAAHGAPVDAPNGGTTPMYRAIFADQFACAEALLDLGADAGFVHDSGTSALHVAADRGATGLCLRLLDGGAQLDHRLGDLGAVHFAVLGGHAECALTLAERGADTGSTGRTLLDLAVEGGSARLVRWCVERGAPVSDAPGAPHGCASAGDAEVLGVLLDAGAAPDEVNDRGITPLHLAADRGHAACVAVLLAAGAAVDPVMPGKGYTPLHLAAMHGFDECVGPLLAAGASRDLADADGHTALDWAKDGPYDACVTLLA